VRGLKLAFVVPRYGRDVVGGAEMLTRGLAAQLGAAGASVEILTTCARSHLTWANELPAGNARDGHVTVRRFVVQPRERAVVRLQERIVRGERLRRDEQVQWAAEAVPTPALLSHLAAHRPDYDLVCFAPYLFGPALQGVHLVERAALIPCLHDEPFAYLDVVREAFERCCGFIFNSLPELELARKLYGLADRPSGVVGLGFDAPPPGDAQRFRRRHRLSGPILLYLGRKERGKNVSLLIEYARRYRRVHRRDVTLVLAGEGPVTVPRRTEGVRDIGFLDEQAKRDAYAAATVVCQPSRNESFSIILMEAWLAGTPVLVHAGCPVTSYHALQAGGGVPFADFYEFAEALTRLLDDAQLRAALGAQGGAYVAREYSWPAVTARLTETLERLLGTPRPSDGAATRAPAGPDDGPNGG
jgi:glycosyltransferase involved in cell wall biosynthesis